MTLVTQAAFSQPITHVVALQDYYPDSARNISIPRPGSVFYPDEWTKVFARGLLKHDFGGKNVLEIGTGAGIHMGLFEQPKPVRHYTGTDICNDAVTAARALAQGNGWNATIIKSGETEVLEQVSDEILSNLDHIFACIPQVPDARKNLCEGDNSSHYYKPTGSYWDQYGLGLNSTLIKQATQRAPQAAITLNLSGRPGIGKLTEMFEYHNRGVRVLHEEMVPQHAGTTLSPLAKMEAEGHKPFEFFADAAGQRYIGATEAESRRVAGRDVFHKVYVLSAQPL